LATDELIVALADGILHLTINRPDQRNALSLAVLDQIGEALKSHSTIDDIKLAIITGTGDRCFAAGGDLKELDAVRSEDQTRMMAERGRAALDEVRYFPAPVIGALNGHALGGGAELAMACDIRIAAAHAELGFLQSTLAVTTAWGGGVDLIQIAGSSTGLQILATGSRMDAQQAKSYGLVDSICPADQPFAEFVSTQVEAYVDKSALVLRGCKAIAAEYRRQMHATLDQLAQDHFVATWTHADHWAAAERALTRNKD